MGAVVVVAAACPRAALALVATSSAAVLSAKRSAASWALAAGATAWSAFFTEYFGSTKAMSAGFGVVSAETDATAAGIVLVRTRAAGTEVAAAEVAATGVSRGATLAATDLATGVVWR